MQRNVGLIPGSALPSRPPSSRPERRHAMPRGMTTMLQNLSATLVYLWLYNGQSFWYYLSHHAEGALRGFVWNGQRWVRRDISWGLVLAYY